MLPVNHNWLLVVLFICMGSVAMAQSKLSPVVKIALDSAKAHQGDATYADCLLKAEAIANASGDAYSKAAVYQRLGNYYYTREPQACIRYQGQAFDLYNSVGDTKAAAISVHSIGFAYEEQLNDVPNAVTYIAKAIDLHKKLNDTIELANMYKYMGMLQGRLGNYDEGKAYVRKAIKYYKMKGYEPGIAVSHFDMAKVYVQQHNYDVAIYHLLASKAYWQKEEVKERLFNVNNELLLVYSSAANDNEAHNMLLENEDILNVTKIYFTDKLNYYKTVYSYYNSNRNKSKAQSYLTRYTVLRDSLVAKNVKVD